MLTHPKSNSLEDYILGLRGHCPLKFFTCGREWPKLATHTYQRQGSPNIFLQW